MRVSIYERVYIVRVSKPYENVYIMQVSLECKSINIIQDCLYFKEVSMHSESGYTSLPRLYSWLSDNPIVPLFLATIFLTHNLTYINNL